MPSKFSLFGVQISAVSYDQGADLMLEAAERHRSMIVTHLPVHGVVTAARDRDYRACINAFDIVAPDGQPVRWALNGFHRTRLTDRCYGPEMMSRLCRGAAERGIGIYLYGSTPEVLDKLQSNLRGRFPSLRIVGIESPPFRPLNANELAQAIQRINGSGAGLVFIGLGCPRQDVFAFEHRQEIHAVQICVGAAFDFHAGTKKTAPPWMQRNGLEWLFRFCQEPRRLWKRYVVTNTLFLCYVLREFIRRTLRLSPQPEAT